MDTYRSRLRPVLSLLFATAHATIVAAQTPSIVPLPSEAAGGLGAPASASPASGPLTAVPGSSRNFSQLDPQPVTHRVSAAVDKLQMIVNTSRILTQDSKIPQAQVNNPEILGLQALSPNQIQVYGKKAGVTQVNIWDEQGNIHSIDVTVFGDVQELARLLHDTFPKAALRVRPVSTGVIISGYVDDADEQNQIIRVAQNYFPEVINHVTVGGVQQVLLQVRVMEVSRTKLRTLGIDMAAVLENGSSVAVAGAGIMTTAPFSAANTIASTGKQTIPFRVANNGDNFFGFIEALKQNNLAKVLADPNIVTESGRPAFMNAGGEFPVLVPQSLGTVSVEYRRFGTQVDFVPIVMGNGIIHLEVRPRVSEIDDTRSITVNGTQVPGLTVREFDVGVNMRAGQTLAIGGLVYTRHNNSVRGIPVLMDTPVVGGFFRRTSVQENEIELLVMVTPQLVDGLDPAQVAGMTMPGTQTTGPNDAQAYVRGQIEIPVNSRQPAHFQREYLITPEGVTGVSGDVMPPAEEVPAGVPMPQPAPTPQAVPMPQATPEPEPAVPSELKIRPAPEPMPTVPRTKPAATDAGQAVRGPVPARLTSSSRTPQPGGTGAEPPPANPAESSTPGLIGPIGYDLTK